MKIKNIKNILAVIIVTTLISCEEVIDIDLNSSNPVLVAEGVINTGSTAMVKLSYTTDYFDTEQAHAEENATIVISDNEGNSEILLHIADGLYLGSEIIGTSNNQYMVTIQNNGEEFEATSFLYPPSEILKVIFEKNETVKPGQNDSYNIITNFKDDTSSRNYYMFKYWINGEIETGSYYLIDDEYYENTGEIEYSPMRPNFELDDEILIELYSIDEETYIYYSKLNDNGEGMMGGSSTPFTPTSNFGDEVLGYFAAWSKIEYVTIVK